jgi:two-component system response regulator HydG
VVLLLDATRRRVASELMRAMESVIPRREVGVLREAARLTFAPATLVGQSPAMQRARAQAVEAAQTRATVFVHGPEASGKEHVARAVHFGGETDGPFLPVNCAGLSEQNLESELFGQVKGASSEALTDRPGALQQANHGTLYLQNVTALTPDLQERLLQALREGKVQRAGSKRVERVEVRVVASDPKDLGTAVREGLRADLAEALGEVEVALPPLADRREDIRELALHFAARHGPGRNLGISDDALAKLEGYRWPGNVRELASVIERACLATDGEVNDVEHLPAPLGDAQVRIGTHELVPAAPPSSAGTVGGTHTASGSLAGSMDQRPWDIGPEEPVSLDLYEKKALLRALHETGGDKLAAARLLGVGKSTLYRKLKRYGIQ